MFNKWVIGFFSLWFDNLFFYLTVLHLLKRCEWELDKVNDKVVEKTEWKVMIGGSQRSLDGEGNGEQDLELSYILSV